MTVSGRVGNFPKSTWCLNGSTPTLVRLHHVVFKASFLFSAAKHNTMTNVWGNEIRVSVPVSLCFWPRWQNCAQAVTKSQHVKWLKAVLSNSVLEDACRLKTGWWEGGSTYQNQQILEAFASATQYCHVMYRRLTAWLWRQAGWTDSMFCLILKCFLLLRL